MSRLKMAVAIRTGASCPAACVTAWVWIGALVQAGSQFTMKTMIAPAVRIATLFKTC